jgi:hypothetical protein
MTSHISKYDVILQGCDVILFVVRFWFSDVLSWYARLPAWTTPMPDVWIFLRSRPAFHKRSEKRSFCEIESVSLFLNIGYNPGMSGYQFLHVEMYARSASKLAGAKRAKKGVVRQSDGIRKNWTAREILAEALRETNACEHVNAPKPPDVLLGDLQSLADELDHLEPPKGQRKDTPVLMAGVASAPWPPGDPRSKAWREDTVEHLQKKFGDALRVVIGHSDEGYDHLHFYVCAPQLAPVKGLHPGQAARAESAARGDDAKAQIEAYNSAMRAWQDQYSAEVGQRHGQTRIGPKRQRVGRMEWMEQKDAAELHAKTVKQAEAQLEQVEKSVAIKRAEVASIEVQKAELKIQSAALDAKAEKFEVQKARLVAWAKDVDAKEKRANWMLDRIMDAMKMLPMALQERIGALFGVPAPTPTPTPGVPLQTASAQKIEPNTETKKVAPKGP